MGPISATDTDPTTSNCHGQNFVPNHPSPKSPLDFGQAFSSIMFSFAGASTFPTIQADMRNREKFPTAAVYAMLSKDRLLWRVFIKCLPHIPVLCAIYLPMSVVGWWLLGDKVGESVVDSLCDGPVTFEDGLIVFLFSFSGKNYDRSFVLDAFNICAANHSESSIPIF